ncbi:molybdopterin-guanine dinucleotide biosynthesis protein MobC [Sodalis sp. dw_96]|uniref:molybdopterin-guanine dinucleotide biosynthesis protein MobC n=1 Tax=Sodalis sp. dw_96 TaxID=2719794 RepID=UPI001BD46BE2|nr:molybdopterin-guanine dinucleotide biosynthesis protein MobC [Sodalis sp. dw_96]
MLIATHNERTARNSEKIKRLLNFLKEETYSDFKTLMLLFGFRDHKSLYTLLSKVEGMGLIQKHVLESRTMKMSLWGITSDGLVTLPNGIVIAVETERRLKTKTRYQSIIASHLLARTRKDWIYVFYIVPDPQKKRAIELLFNSIKYVIVNHQHIPLEARHRHVFRVYTLDELHQLELHHYA